MTIYKASSKMEPVYVGVKIALPTTLLKEIAFNSA